MTAAPLTPSEAGRLFPRGVGDPFCPRGGLIGTSTDHRLLWHLAAVLSVDARTGSRLGDVRRDLRQYLSVRCRFHLFADRGIAGVQIPGWQIDVRDHRLSPPLFSARELGHYCGRHFGHYCLRSGRTR